MIPQPQVLGLTLCEKAIVEEGTKNITLVSAFTRLVSEEFPTLRQRFALHTVLTGGLGTGIIDMNGWPIAGCKSSKGRHDHGDNTNTLPLSRGPSRNPIRQFREPVIHLRNPWRYNSTACATQLSSSVLARAEATR